MNEILNFLVDGFISIIEFSKMFLKRILGIEHKEYEQILNEYEIEFSKMLDYLILSNDTSNKKIKEVKKYCLMKLKNTDTEDKYKNYILYRKLYDKYEADNKDCLYLIEEPSLFDYMGVTKK